MIPEQYPLVETATDEYPERTERNVCEADGTLILTRGQPDRGTALTARLANRHKKPLYVVDLAEPAADEAERVRQWLVRQTIEVLNVAGPRKSAHEGIHAQAAAFLRTVIGG